jgi:hypothetical protein
LAPAAAGAEVPALEQLFALDEVTVQDSNVAPVVLSITATNHVS